MGLPGPKLMGEEKFSLDIFGVSTPRFVTTRHKSNAHLQKWSEKNAQIFISSISKIPTSRTDHAGVMGENAEQPV